MAAKTAVHGTARCRCLRFISASIEPSFCVNRGGRARLRGAESFHRVSVNKRVGKRRRKVHEKKKKEEPSISISGVRCEREILRVTASVRLVPAAART